MLSDSLLCVVETAHKLTAITVVVTPKPQTDGPTGRAPGGGLGLPDAGVWLGLLCGLVRHGLEEDSSLVL